jgi:hypothetical protein
MDERLFDYLMGHLDPAVATLLEAEMAARPELAAQLDSLRRALGPLAEVNVPDPPPDLALSTLALVAEHNCKPLPSAPRRPFRPASDPDRRPGRWRDWIVAASVCVIVGGLLTAGVSRAWGQYNIRACQQNLASLWASLAQYGQQHRGALPTVQDVPGPQGVAAAYVPLLFQAGVVGEGPLNVGCPARGRKTAEPCTLPPLEQLFQEDPQGFRQRVRDLAGDYAYTLGYRDNGTLCGPRLDAGTEVPLLADGPSASGEGNSPNHGGRGQNVLFIGGHVRWLASPVVGPQLDDIYLNRARQIRAGLDACDFVLGCGDAVTGP